MKPNRIVWSALAATLVLAQGVAAQVRLGAADFDELIATLQQTLGLTVFMVTHDLDSLFSICDRVAALADGKVIAAGPLPTLLESSHPWLRSYFHGVRGGRLTAGAAARGDA